MNTYILLCLLINTHTEWWMRLEAIKSSLSCPGTLQHWTGSAGKPQTFWLVVDPLHLKSHSHSLYAFLYSLNTIICSISGHCSSMPHLFCWPHFLKYYTNLASVSRQPHIQEACLVLFFTSKNIILMFPLSKSTSTSRICVFSYFFPFYTESVFSELSHTGNGNTKQRQQGLCLQ